MSNSLQNITVMVTRPKPAGEKLCELIQAEGAHTVFFPTIEIVPPENLDELKQKLTEVNQQDWLIFLSPQAVAPFSERNFTQLPDTIKIAAVGAGTAECLNTAGFSIVRTPVEDWSSEGLLALPDFQDLTGKKIALIKGEGGRDLLHTALIARGATVTDIIVYRRILPKVDATSTVNLLRQHKVNAIVCASGEAVQNLKKILGDQDWVDLANVPLVVVSQRIADIANSLGFKHISVAKNASHRAIIETLRGIAMPNQTELTETPKRSGISYDAVETFVICLMVLLLVAAVGYVYYNLNSVNVHLSKRIATLESQNTHEQTETDAIKDITDQMQQLRGQLATQQQAINQFNSIQHNNQDLLATSEAQYLTRLAENNLELAYNIPMAIKLLEAADEELSHLTDARAAPVRKAVADDIATLKNIPAVDVSGVFNRLASLNEQLDKLPLVTKQVSGEQKISTDISDASRLPWWKRGLYQSWQGLQKIVVVQYSENNAPPLVSPDQQGLLYLNLHSIVQNAQWAVLHKKSDIYQASLKQATEWVNQYFVQDSDATKAVLNNLNELQQVDVRPDIPKELSSVQAFKDYFNQDVAKTS